MIYFAGSIRGGREDKRLYLYIIELLKSYGKVLTEHIGDTTISDVGESIGEKDIHDRDVAWIKLADYFVAEVTTPSLGVGYEIGKATEWGKPVLCLFRPNQDRSLSAMIAGCSEVILKEYTDINELKEIFRNFFGKERIEP